MGLKEVFSAVKLTSPLLSVDHQKTVRLDLGRSHFDFVSFWVFVLIFCVYLKTLCPTVSGGDSGELISVIHNWGIAHPPGYPLYTLLGKAVTVFLPLGSVAWRVNLFSAWADAVAGALIYLSVKQLTASKSSGVLAAGIFAFSPLVWRYAIVAEVFALNNLFLSALILLSIHYIDKMRQGQEKGIANGLFFLSGLGLSHHHSLILFVAPICCALVWTLRGRWKDLCFGGLLFCTGLLPYLYLPWAGAVQGPLHSVHRWGDLTSWAGFFIHVFRREYGTWSLASDVLGTEFRFFSLFWLYLKEQTLSTFGLGPVFGLLGLWFIKREYLLAPRTSVRGYLGAYFPLFTVWVFSFFLYLGVFCSFSHLDPSEPLYVTVQNRFWQLPHVLICVLSGVGIAKGFKGRRGSWILPFILCGQLAWLWPKMDQSRNDSFQLFGNSILRSLPEKSLLIVSGDYVFHALRYVQGVERVRPEVPILHLSLLSASWSAKMLRSAFPELVIPKNGIYGPGGYSMKDFFDANSLHFNFFGCNGMVKAWDKSLEGQYYTWPMGWVEQAMPLGKAPELLFWAQAGHSFFQDYPIDRLKSVTSETWEYRLLGLYWEMRQFFAERLQEYLLNSESSPLKNESATPPSTHTVQEPYLLALQILIQELQAITQGPWPYLPQKKEDLSRGKELLKIRSWKKT